MLTRNDDHEVHDQAELHGHAVRLLDAGDRHAALLAFEIAAHRLADLVRSGHGERAIQLADLRLKVATLHNIAGNPPAAIRWLLLAKSGLARTLEVAPETALIRCAKIDLQLGVALRNQGRLPESTASYRAARLAFSQLLELGHGSICQELAGAAYDLGRALQGGEDAAAAVEEYRRAALALAGTEPQILADWLLLAAINNNLGGALLQSGQCVAARVVLQKAAQHYATAAEKGHLPAFDGLCAARLNLLETLTVGPPTTASYQVAAEVLQVLDLAERLLGTATLQRSRPLMRLIQRTLGSSYCSSQLRRELDARLACQIPATRASSR